MKALRAGLGLALAIASMAVAPKSVAGACLLMVASLFFLFGG